MATAFLVGVELAGKGRCVADWNGEWRCFDIRGETELHGNELLGEGVRGLALTLGFGGFFFLGLGLALGEEFWGDGLHEPEAQTKGEGDAVAAEGGELAVEV